jgi:hypothetical protein
MSLVFHEYNDAPKTVAVPSKLSCTRNLMPFCSPDFTLRDFDSPV